MVKKYLLVVFIVQLLAAYSLAQAAPKNGKPRPHVVVIGVNGMEWDFIRPLLLRGEMPNLSRVLHSGVYGKLRTVDRKSTRLNSSHMVQSRMPSSA